MTKNIKGEKRMGKRIISIVLVAVMCSCAFLASAWRADASKQDAGVLSEMKLNGIPLTIMNEETEPLAEVETDEAGNEGEETPAEPGTDEADSEGEETPAEPWTGETGSEGEKAPAEPGTGETGSEGEKAPAEPGTGETGGEGEETPAEPGTDESGSEGEETPAEPGTGESGSEGEETPETGGEGTADGEQTPSEPSDAEKTEENEQQEDLKEDALPGTALGENIEPFDASSLPPLKISDFQNNIFDGEARVKVAVGENHVLVLDEGGEVWSIGSNANGQLGLGESISYTNELQHIKTLHNIVSIKAKGNYSMALDSDGNMWTWGVNDRGQLGVGDKFDRWTPDKNKYLNNVAEVYAGWLHAAAITKDGKLYLWGLNESGQLGDGGVQKKLKPTLITGMENPVKVALGYRHTMVLTADRKVYIFGSGSFAQISRGGELTELEGASDVDCGMYHSAAVVNRRLYTWGRNNYGQLGDETRDNRSDPQPVNYSSTGQVQCGAYYTVVTGGRNEFEAAGDNSCYQFGRSTKKYYSIYWVSTRLRKELRDEMTSATVGANNIIFTDKNGLIYGCGSNEYGQLGREILPDMEGQPHRNHYTEPIKQTRGYFAHYDIPRGGDECLLMIRAGDLYSPKDSKNSFEIRYNAEWLELADVYAQTEIEDTVAGTYGNITVIGIEPGVIRFSLNLPQYGASTFDGIITMIKFRKLTNFSGEVELEATI